MKDVKKRLLLQNLDTNWNSNYIATSMISVNLSQIFFEINSLIL